MSTATLERAFGEVASYVAGPSGNASTSNIYAGEGVNLSAGSRRRRERNDPRYLTALTEAAELYARVIEGDAYAALRFAEAMTTSDFSHLFGDILDRQILAKYQQAPVQWDAVARRGKSAVGMTVLGMCHGDMPGRRFNRPCNDRGCLQAIGPFEKIGGIEDNAQMFRAHFRDQAHGISG